MCFFFIRKTQTNKKTEKKNEIDTKDKKATARSIRTFGQKRMQLHAKLNLKKKLKQPTEIKKNLFKKRETRLIEKNLWQLNIYIGNKSMVP